MKIQDLVEKTNTSSLLWLTFIIMQRHIWTGVASHVSLQKICFNAITQSKIKSNKGELVGLLSDWSQWIR
jgi:hypothetical protein